MYKRQNIDQAEDLCIGSVDFKEKSGFAKTTSKVSLSYINHGVTPQKNITLRYWLNTADDPYAPTKTPYAEETVADEVQPGETVTYTFEKEADVSKGGETYALVGSIVTKVGEDQQNDLIAGTTSLENWAVPSLPYTQGFEESTTAQKQWTFTQEGISKWLVGNNSAGAYQGSKSLCHTGKVAEGKEDWAFSEPLQLEKGTYDIAFFYRTTKNYKLATQAQTFRAMLGTAPEADKMTTQLLKEEDLLVSGQWSKKYSGTFTVDEAGTYYLGFGNTTANAQGMTFVDNISSALMPTDRLCLTPSTSMPTTPRRAWRNIILHRPCASGSLPTRKTAQRLRWWSAHRCSATFLTALMATSCCLSFRWRRVRR